MKKFFRRFFGVKNSSVKEVVVRSVYNVDDFQKAVRTGDIDLVIAYVEAGENVNETFDVEYSDVVDGQYDCTYNVKHVPLDFVRNSDIEQYLRRHGALTSEELKKLRDKEEEERQKQRDKENEERMRLYEIEKAKKEDYIRKRIAEVEGKQ